MPEKISKIRRKRFNWQNKPSKIIGIIEVSASEDRIKQNWIQKNSLDSQKAGFRFWKIQLFQKIKNLICSSIDSDIERKDIVDEFAYEKEKNHLSVTKSFV